LERANLSAPIHVFGALDPLACALYFLAGAELFDGLNWMRYAFLDDAAIYSRQATLVRGTPDEDDSAAQRRLIPENLTALRRLQSLWREFLSDGNLEHFGRHRERLVTAWAHVQTYLREKAGG
jgi:hypothetical protein